SVVPPLHTSSASLSATSPSSWPRVEKWPTRSGQPRQGSAVSGVPYLGGTAWATIPRWMGRGRLGVERRGVLWRSYPVSRGRENEKPRRQFERPVGRDGGMRGSTRGRGGSRRAAAPAAHALPS